MSARLVDLRWNRDSQPSNGSRSVCLHRDGGLSVSKPRFGEWTNCVNGSEYVEGDVIGWMSDDRFPFDSLSVSDLAELTLTGMTRPGVMHDSEGGTT